MQVRTISTDHSPMTSIAQAKPRTQTRRRTLPRWTYFVLTGLLFVAVLAAAVWSLLRPAVPVTVVVNGVEMVIRTSEADPEELLARLGYPAHPNDAVTVPEGELGAGARIVVHQARPVVLNVDGTTREVRTQAQTVGELLAESGVMVGWRDIVTLNDKPVDLATALPEPVWTAPADGLPHMPWERNAEPVGIGVIRAVAITITDGDAVPATLYTTASTIGEALAEAETPIYEGDSVFPAPDTKVSQGQHVLILRSLPIEIRVDGKIIETRTRQETVGDALAEKGIILVGLDQVQPALATELSSHTSIEITRISEEVTYGEEVLPFNTVWAPDDDIPIDQRQIKNRGREGIQRYRYRIRYEDGEEVARVLEDSWIAVEPETKVIAYGRKITPQTLETPEGTITYWRKVRMYATSYSPKRSGTPKSAPWYGRTRLGMQLAKGIVAVDPAVVNMRQKVYVPGYGTAIAGDTGGGVKGKHIDLGYRDDDYISWHRWTDVYLLWPPPPTYSIRYVLPNWPRYPDRGR